MLIPSAGEHGGDAIAIARALDWRASDVLDLSASLNPLAPDPAPVVARHLDALQRYPDVTLATAALARAIGVGAEQLLLTNGAAEAIALVAAEVQRGWVEEPDFSLYRRHLASVERGAPLFRSNPHNPTGLLAGAKERAGVWDESFYPLATGAWTRGDGDAVVVGSLTKLLRCPGLRLGYVLCSDLDLMARLQCRQPLWSVGSLAADSLPELLDPVDLPRWSAGVAILRDELVSVLREHGLAPRRSDANFVLVDEAAGLRERLARHGVLVRDCASFGMPGTARVAVPDRDGLERLDRALGATVATGRSR